MSVFNSLWPSDAIWRHRSRTTVAQVMACCLTAPSHYLNQCWLIICEVLCHWPVSNCTMHAQATIWCNVFENYTFKITATSPTAQWINFNKTYQEHSYISHFLQDTFFYLKCLHFVIVYQTVDVAHFAVKCQLYISMKPYNFPWTTLNGHLWFCKGSPWILIQFRPLHLMLLSTPKLGWSIFDCLSILFPWDTTF